MNNPGKMILNMARSRLLATVSTLTLITSVCGYEVALAAEAGHEPVLWIEFGWQADSAGYSERNLDLPLGPLVPPSGLTAPLMQHLKTYRSNDVEGKITYTPQGNDWDFSASVRYGRSGGKTLINQSKPPLPTESFVYYHTYFRYTPDYIFHQSRSRAVKGGHPKLNGEIDNAEAHFIVDFEAGKDVGLGLFGTTGTSTLSAGARFAHFALSREIPNFHESPGDVHFHTSHTTTFFSGNPDRPWFKTRRGETWNEISANGGTSQNFNGIGPSIRWDASAQLWNDPRGGGISLDWGANAALLFGKQTKKIHHQTTNTEHCIGPSCHEGYSYPAAQSNAQVRSSRTITVPNVGGFAGLSLKYTDVKISLGYRADFFFNAIDGGIDTRKNENRGFYGPFASMSIGLGD